MSTKLQDAPAIPLEEFEQEMAVTRRVLERVPDDDPNWKPHPKSFSIAHLAQLIARMPGWFTATLRDPGIELSQAGGYSNEKTATLLETFDANVAAARQALKEVTGPALNEMWSLTLNGKPLMSMPRAAVMRQNMSHLVHHRGQMTVYLRLRDVPVPSTYGPTADEPWNG